MIVKGSTALITGGASGLGRAFCAALQAKGIKSLAVLDRDEKLGKKVEEELRAAGVEARFFKCDVSDAASFKDSFAAAEQAFGPPTIVCNNAGIGHDMNWRQTIAINLVGVMHGTYMAIESLTKASKPGVIVNVASMAGLLPLPAVPSYTASKHGVVGFSRAFPQLRAKGIRVNCLCPSFADTPLVQFGLAVDKNFAKIVESQGELIKPELVATAFLQLVEDDKLSGAVMRVTNQKGIDLQVYGSFEKKALEQVGGSKL